MRKTEFESLFTNQGFPSQSSIEHLKELISRFNENSDNQFKHSVRAIDLMHARAHFIDGLLISCWQHYFGKDANQVSLIAVGGYGRRELHPCSDIDLLIILEVVSREKFTDELENFCRLLWDIGLKPGLGVRTVAECIKTALDDQTVTTNLMESRLLSGSKNLYTDLKDKTGPAHMWSSKAFFDAKMEERKNRYIKFHDTAFSLEPNVKEGPGGLRDIQIIAWLLKRHYQSQTLGQLVEKSCITESEYAELMEAQNFLWTVRYALHVSPHRCENRLLFDYQKTVATFFGFIDSEGQNAVEGFMQQYFSTVTRVERLSEMLLQSFQEVILEENSNCEIVAINQHFQSLCDVVEVVDEHVFEKNPFALLEIFLLLQQNPKLTGIRASTIRLIRENLNLIDDDFRHDSRATHIFMEILRQPGGITHEFRRMNRYGILAAYIPDFANIVGRMQYDLFHVYTVDAHTMFVIRNLRRMALHKHKDELPTCYEISEFIAKPELLYLAALLHDIAKGRGGDHSKIGETVAENFCLRHRLGRTDTRLVCWLVRNHLLMSMTAQRKDISDPDVIMEFAAIAGNQDYLNHLYLLTVADIRGTNPTLWNSWKDLLLKDLYSVTSQAFRRGLSNPELQHEKMEDIKHEAMDMLEKLGFDEKKVNKVWHRMSNDYFLRYSPEEIAWHTIAIASCKEKDLPLVVLRPQSQHGSAEVFLYTKNQDALFANSTALLDQLDLTILDARILTSKDNYALNSYLVLEESGEPIGNIIRKLEICNQLRNGLLNEESIPVNIKRREPRQAKHFPIKSSVSFPSGTQRHHTVVEIITTDRPGLLSKVGRVFNRFNIRVVNAKITTIGSRAEDIFYVTDSKNQLLMPELLSPLKDALLEEVS